jgi:hypothetical protein
MGSCLTDARRRNCGRHATPPSRRTRLTAGTDATKSFSTRINDTDQEPDVTFREPLPPLSFENNKVAHLMKCLLPDDRKGERIEWARAIRRASDGCYLTFRGMSAVGLKGIGGMPLTIRTQYRSGRTEIDHSYLCKLERSYLAEDFFTHRDMVGTEEFALVVNMPCVKGGVVLHTYSEAAHALGDTVIKCRLIPFAGSEAEDLTLQPYASFAKWVAQRWLARQPLRPDMLEYSIAAVAGSLPASATLLLLWLRDLWHKSKSTDYLKLTRQWIVRETGLALNTVANSLKKLAEAKLIDTVRGDHCVLIRVL